MLGPVMAPVEVRLWDELESPLAELAALGS